MHLDLNHCQLAIAALRSERKSGWLKSWVNVSDGSESRHVHFSCTVRTEVFSTKSPWSVFFRGEMVVIKCLWNHSETFTAKIYKLGPKCRWNILIVGDNTVAKIVHVFCFIINPLNINLLTYTWKKSTF
jgi:hypothetical protein